MARDSEVNLCVKYTLFFICFFLFLVTGGCTGVIAYYLAVREDLNIDSFLAFVADWSCLLCVLSSCLFVMSFVGWLGALREYRTCLLIFKIILGVLMLLELVAVILIFLLAFEQNTQELLYDDKTYREAIVKYRDPEFESLHETIDTLQRDWKCCGVSNNEEGYKDWTVNQYFNCSSDIPASIRDIGDFCSVPYTCCKDQEGIPNIACGRNMADPDTDETVRQSTIYTKGCFLSLTEIVRDNILWIGIVTLCILIPQAFLYKLGSDLRFQIFLQRSKWLKHQGNFDRITGR